MAAGVPQDCAANLTKDHANAAIAVCQADAKGKTAALLTIRKSAASIADQLENTEVSGRKFEPSIRAIAKLASEALA